MNLNLHKTSIIELKDMKKILKLPSPKLTKKSIKKQTKEFKIELINDNKPKVIRKPTSLSPNPRHK